MQSVSVKTGDPDPDRMTRRVREARKPCLGFKVLGAGRMCKNAQMLEKAFEYAYRSIKPVDGVIDLPLQMKDGKLTLAHKTPPVNWIYPLIFSDMSIGALSTRAWESVALATAYLNEKCGLPVRMSSGEGGMPVKLMEAEELKYMINRCKKCICP